MIGARCAAVRSAAALIALTATGAGLAAGPPRACSSRPNVLIVALDGVRADATSLHASPLNETPVLRTLSGRGVNFRTTYSTSDTVTMALFSLVTGFKVGDQSPFDDVERSLPYQLEQQGYRTFAVLSNANVTATLVRSLPGFRDRVNLADLWPQLDPVAKAAAEARADERLLLYGVAKTDLYRRALFMSAEAVVDQTIPRLTREQPFAGLIELAATHPWLPDPSMYGQAEIVPVPDLRHRRLTGELRFPQDIEDDARRDYVRLTIDRARGRNWTTTFDLTPDQIAVYRQRYHGEVREVDRAVGRLIAALENRQLLDSTIVAIVGTMGQSFGERNLITDSFNDRGDHEALRRVPLLLLLPQCFGVAPKAVDHSVSTADVAVTVYDLVGIDPGQLWRGASLARGRSLVSLLPDLRPIDVPVRRAYAAPVTNVDLLDDREITLQRTADVGPRRDALIHHVWGKAGLPRNALPAAVERDVASPMAASPNLRRVDKLRIELNANLSTVAYHMIPRRPNGRVVIVHQGHTCLGFFDPTTGLPAVARALLSAGYGVVAMEMVKERPEDCGGPGSHNSLFAQLHGEATAFRFFFEPVTAVMNHLQASASRDGVPRDRRVDMVGLSGGGWVATIYPALDPRIGTSISVAGSLPLYLRTGWSIGDLEQTERSFYRLAGYPDLYVMNASGGGRRHIQVVNRKDTCCFGQDQHEDAETYDSDLRSYEAAVRAALARLGSPADAFRLHIDEVATSHTISAWALNEVILPALRR